MGEFEREGEREGVKRERQWEKGEKERGGGWREKEGVRVKEGERRWGRERGERKRWETICWLGMDRQSFWCNQFYLPSINEGYRLLKQERYLTNNNIDLNILLHLLTCHSLQKKTKKKEKEKKCKSLTAAAKMFQIFGCSIDYLYNYTKIINKILLKKKQKDIISAQWHYY